MRRIGTGVALALMLAMTTGAAGADSPAAVGLWMTAVSDEGRFLHVRIDPCADAPGELCGTIAEVGGGADPANVGKPIIWDMAPDGEGRWSGGRVWAADEDEVYRAKMAMAGPDTLTLSGCILGGLLCRGQDWTRLAD